MIHDLLPLQTRRRPSAPGGHRDYRAACSCGGIGPWRDDWRRAEDDHWWHALSQQLNERDELRRPKGKLLLGIST